MIRFHCPTCRKKLKAHDNQGGKIAVCPRCAARTYVPSDQPPASAIICPSPVPIEPLGAAAPESDYQDQPPIRYQQAPDDDNDDDSLSVCDPLPQSSGSGWTLAVALGVAMMIAVFTGLAIILATASSPTPNRTYPVPNRTFQDISRKIEEGRRPPSFKDDTDDLAGAIITTWIVVLVFLVIILVLEILIMAWVTKDCRARGVDGAAVWVLVILLSFVVGLLVYLASRPQGTLVDCRRCGNRRLQFARACPHCGARQKG